MFCSTANSIVYVLANLLVCISSSIQFNFALYFYNSLIGMTFMNKLSMIVAITISMASVLLIMIPHTTQNTNAYSCSSSAAVSKLNVDSGIVGSSGVNSRGFPVDQPNGSCATSASSSTSNRESTASCTPVPSPAPACDTGAAGSNHGGVDSSTVGGGQTSCSSAFNHKPSGFSVSGVESHSIANPSQAGVEEKCSSKIPG